MPDAPAWEIVESFVDSSEDGKVKLEATKTVPYGESFPESFAENDKETDHLRFPTAIKMWTEGDRTFYEFSRTYKGRRHMRYHYAEEHNGEEEIEKKVWESGIFSLTEQERENYLDNLGMSYGVYYFMIYSDALGNMVHRDELSAATKRSLETAAQPLLENLLAPDTLLNLLSMDDSTMTVAYDRLTDDIYRKLGDLCATGAADSGAVRRAYNASLNKFRTEHEITQSLDGSEIMLSLAMPGEIIHTNGLTDPEEPGNVAFMFEGRDLHDADISCYVLSVVER